MESLGLRVKNREKTPTSNWVKLTEQIKDLEEMWNDGRGKIRIVRIPPFLKSPYETNFYGYYHRSIEHLDIKKGDKVPSPQDAVGNGGVKYSKPFQIQTKITKIPPKKDNETIVEKKKRKAIKLRHEHLEKNKEESINYGICIGAYPEKNEGYKLSVIDIDGYVNKKTVDDKYKKETAELITDILMKIPGTMKVRTPSGGVHLYLWQKEDTDYKEHYISERLSFPKDFPIKELQKQSLKGSVEIFTNERTRQIVLPGSTVKTSDGEIKEYQIIGDINRFSDIAKVDNVHELVKNTLLEHGYSFNPKLKVENISVEHTHDSNLDKDKIVKLLSPVFKELTGSHNDSYLALGGIFLRAGVSREEATEIVQRVLNETEDDDVERHLNQQVLGTYDKYEEENGEVNLTGFPKLKEQMLLNEFNNKEINSFELNLNLLLKNEYEIRILVEERNNGKSDIVFNYHDKTVIWEEWKDIPLKDDEGNIVVDEKGEKVFVSTLILKTIICAFVPIEVNGVKDIIDPNSPIKTKMKYCVNNDIEPQEIVGADMDVLKRELRRTPDIVLDVSRYNKHNIVNYASNEFRKRGLYNIEREPSVSGVFLDKKSGKFLIKNTEGKTSRPIKPEKEDIIQAVKIIEKLFNHFKKTVPDSIPKRAYILRHCMLLPLNFIIKQLNRKHLRLLLLVGESDTAKALDLNTPIPTPTGWSTMGDLCIGDEVFDEQGNICNVTHKSEIFTNHDCYKITFDNGEEIIADAGHRFSVKDINLRNKLNIKEKNLIKTTEELLEKVKVKQVNNWSIDLPKKLNLSNKNLPINPYILGIWLADENSNMNLLGNKHIPDIYLRASYEQRLELIRGFMDGSNYSDKNKSENRLVLSNKKLLEQFSELLSSCGIKTNKIVEELYDCSKNRSKSKYSKFKYTISFTTNLNNDKVFIKSIEKIESVPTQCIAVDSPNHLFLGGKSMIPTHNTSTTEIGLCFHNLPKTDFNKTNGESIKSEAQLGEYFEKHGWGLLVDEGAEIVTGKYAKNYLEFFKSAIESDTARKRYRGSTNTLFKSYTNMVITSNEIPSLNHEDVKRIAMIDFDINDVIPPETHKEFAETFNIYGSYEESDFNSLSPIGDWFIWYLDKHQELFQEHVEDIPFKVLEAMFEYIDYPIVEELFIEYETWTTSKFADEKFDNFRRFILHKYNSSLGMDARNYNSETMVSIEKTVPVSKSAREKMKEELWRQITNRNHVFLDAKDMDDGSNGVVIRANLKKEMDISVFDSIKCSDLIQFYDIICDYDIPYKNYRVNNNISKGIHIKFDDFFDSL